MTMINVKERYATSLASLKENTSISNTMALPRIVKVSVNVGLGMYRQNKEMVSYIEQSLKDITGQKPVSTFARKAISGFKLREGDLVGLRVTLRGERMYDFLNRLVNITLPRIRDFKGINPSNFDGQGNLTIGFKDQVPFAELGNDVLEKPFGLTLTLTIANGSKEKSSALLQALGFPLKLN